MRRSGYLVGLRAMVVRVVGTSCAVLCVVGSSCAVLCVFPPGPELQLCPRLRCSSTLKGGEEAFKWCHSSAGLCYILYILWCYSLYTLCSLSLLLLFYYYSVPENYWRCINTILWFVILLFIYEFIFIPTKLASNVCFSTMANANWNSLRVDYIHS